jgi:hypothetical protein
MDHIATHARQACLGRIRVRHTRLAYRKSHIGNALVQGSCTPRGIAAWEREQRARMPLGRAGRARFQEPKRTSGELHECTTK